MPRLEALREGSRPGRWRRVAVQAALLCWIPALLALAVNHVRDGGIPLVADTDYADDILVPCPENLIEADPVELAALSSDLAGLTIIDTRPRGDFLAGHIPGAMNIPLRPVGADHAVYQGAIRNDLAPLTELAPLLELRDVEIVVCGDPRLRSGQNMASVILEQGFRNVRYLAGGCNAWLEAGWSFAGVQDGVLAVTVADLPADLHGMTIIDARFGRYYRRGHVPEAISIPYMMVSGPEDARLDPIRGIPADTILVYGDATRGEGQNLARVLADAGWPGVRYLEGGFDAWVADHRPTQAPTSDGEGGQ